MSRLKKLNRTRLSSLDDRSQPALVVDSRRTAPCPNHETGRSCSGTPWRLGGRSRLPADNAVNGRRPAYPAALVTPLRRAGCEPGRPEFESALHVDECERPHVRESMADPRLRRNERRSRRPLLQNGVRRREARIKPRARDLCIGRLTCTNELPPTKLSAQSTFASFGSSRELVSSQPRPRTRRSGHHRV